MVITAYKASLLIVTLTLFAHPSAIIGVVIQILNVCSEVQPAVFCLAGYPHPPSCTLCFTVSPRMLCPPLIANSGCTGILVQQSNFPALSPFFTAKPLPLVPSTLPDGSVLRVGGGSPPHWGAYLSPQTPPCPRVFPSRILSFALSAWGIPLNPASRPVRFH